MTRDASMSRRPPAGAPAATVGLTIALGLLAALTVLAAVRHAPPAPAPASAPASEFSAERAMASLGDLLGEGMPHPAGTEANARVRARVVALFERAGYAPQVRQGFACAEWGSCADVRNVVARLPGAGSRAGAVLLVAHYDSQPAGPGASDDGINVAALLEIARILKAGPALERDVIFLVDDGEELGLIGARSFVESDPWAADVGVVLNLEGRGSSGPSMMFETSAGNASLIAAFSRSVSRPFGASTFTTIYDLMPNDTDFSVFKAHGYAGLNFAHIGNLEHYHTPRDDLSHASPATLQHHGANALALTRELAASDLPLPDTGDSVFFDVFSFGVVRWPAAATLPLALASVLGIASAGFSLARGGGVTVRQLCWAVAAWPLMLAAPVGGAWLLDWTHRAASGLASPWTASPFPARVAIWSVCFAAVLSVGGLFARRAGPWGLWLGVWGGLAVGGAILAVALPGLSYPAMVPALVAALAVFATGSLRDPGSDTRRIVACIAPLIVSAAIWLPVVLALEDTFGLGAAPLVASALAFVVISLAPLLAGVSARPRHLLAGAALATALIAAATAAVLPHATADIPMHASIVYHEDADSGGARWLVETSGGRAPRAMEEAGSLGSEIAVLLPFLSDRERAQQGPAPARATPGPEVTVLASEPHGGDRSLRLHVRSQRGARAIALYFAPDAEVRSVLVAGTPLPEPNARVRRFASGWRRVAHMTAPAGGFEVMVVLGNPDPVEVYVVDQVFELPPEADPLVAARPETAVPVHDGDHWLLTTRLSL